MARFYHSREQCHECGKVTSHYRDDDGPPYCGDCRGRFDKAEAAQESIAAQVFSGRELARLRFVRFLHATGRINEGQEVAR